MSSYNRIVLMGNLTRDPELSYTPANTAVCKFGIATNRKWRDREGGERFVVESFKTQHGSSASS